MLRGISVLVCLAFAAPSVAQESASVVFLMSPYYADVERSVARSTGEKSIDPSWCRPGADLVAFAWADEFASVARGNTPVPLIHAILSDPGGACEYFTVYTSFYAVPPVVGKKLAGWEPTLSRPHDENHAATAAEPQALAAAPQPVTAPVSEEQREAGPPPLPRPKPQLAEVKRIAAPSKPTTPTPPLAPRAAVQPGPQSTRR